jgi:hypothetical protein
VEVRGKSKVRQKIKIQENNDFNLFRKGVDHMRNIKDLSLTEKEKQYLIKLEKSGNKMVYGNYIVAALSLCAAIVGLVIGLKWKEEEGFLMLILFGSLGYVLFMSTWGYQKHSRIIVKLKQYIEEHAECK